MMQVGLWVDSAFWSYTFNTSGSTDMSPCHGNKHKQSLAELI